MMALANDTTYNSAVKILTRNLAGAGTDKSEYKIDKALQEAEALKVNVIAFQETKARSNNWVANTLIKYGHRGWNVSECCNGEGMVLQYWLREVTQGLLTLSFFMLIHFVQTAGNGRMIAEVIKVELWQFPLSKALNSL